MLCSTLSDHAYNDWLQVSPINRDRSCNEENDGTELSLGFNYIHSLANDDFSDRNSLLSNQYFTSVLPVSHSTSDLGKTLMHLLSPSTDVFDPSNSSPSLDSHCILSPTHTGTINHLQDTPFDDCYRLLTPLVSSDSYISPIVRASSLGSRADRLPSCTSDRPGISTSLDSENSSFLDRLRATVRSTSSPDHIQIYSSKPPCLLSPCQPSITRCLATPPVTPKQQILCDIPSTSDPTLLFSPLTPLPEDAIHFQGSTTPETNTIIKRRLSFQDVPSSRPTKARRILRSSHAEPGQLLAALLSPVPELPPRPRSPVPQLLCIPIFTNRTFPEFVPISSDFPMFYRRFPASSYLRELSMDAPKTRHPGGIYNPPRWPLDLYAPRFVKGKGTAKLGLCPICIEPAERGGHDVKLWFAMKFSAFNYHMQYTHGISASTGLPFSPPVAYRRTKRLEVGKKEKHIIQEGKCHKCKKWVAVEGIKDMESKVKEIFWWKHAASCHHGSTIPGESHEDVYERDHVHERLLELTNGVGP